jgi:hypothetical protein
MKIIEIWKGFCDALSTQGGSLLLLTIILFAFFPMLIKNDSEGWKAAMFLLGAIAGLINSQHRNPPPPPSLPKE